MWSVVWTLLVFGFTGFDAYRILGLFAHPGKSHYVVYSPLMKGKSSLSSKKSFKKIKYVLIE